MADHQKKVANKPAWLKAHVPLAHHTTLKVGGEATWYGVAESVADMQSAIRFAAQNGLPIRVIGGGSNLLVPDTGFAGVVVRNGLSGITYEATKEGMVHATIGAGEVFDEVIADMVARGYWGLENLSAIPGTVGATPIQNVGAYGVEVSDCIVRVGCLHTPSAQVVTLTRSECEFSCRDSFFKTTLGREYVILSVTFALSTQSIPRIGYADLTRVLTPDSTLSVVRDAITKIRAEKFPDWHRVGTAGSFFKNPIIPVVHAQQLQSLYPELPVYPVSTTHMKVSLGYILDKVCGLKGYGRGGVALYEKQALVLVNTQSCTANITSFAEEIADIVKAKTNIIIEREVTDLV